MAASSTHASEGADSSSATTRSLPLRRPVDWVVAARVTDGAELRALDPSDRNAWSPSVVWHAPGCVALGWSSEPADGGSPERGLALVSGQLRWPNRSWTDPVTWPATMQENRTAPPYGDPLDNVTGHGTAVLIDGQGRGVLSADSLGHSAIYEARTPEVALFGSRPQLVVDAAARLGTHLPRSALAGACFAYVGHVIDSITSFEGVHRLPTGSRVVLDGRRPPRIERRDVPWRRGGGLEGLSPDELIDVVDGAIVDHLVAARELSDERPVLDLTGGKDSRLLLAVALAHTDISDFRVRTVGTDEFPDVVAARHICAQLGIEHENGIHLRAHPLPFAERAHQFLARTDGMHSAWMMVVPEERAPEVRLSATAGEILRTVPVEDAWWESREDSDEPTTESIAHWLVARNRRGPKSFLLPEVRNDLEEVLVRHVHQLSRDGVPAADLLSAFFIGHHATKLAGLRLELETDHRPRPLADPTAARAAYVLGTRARTDELIHRALIRRASPELETMPFVTGCWNTEARRGGGGSTDRSPRPTAGQRRASPTRVRTPGNSFLGSAQAASTDGQRRAFVADALSGRANPIWGVADRERTTAALDRFDDLPMKPRQRLYGLATAAIWLTQ